MEIICADCGRPWLRTSNVQKRCPDCSKARRREKQTAGMRVRRAAKSAPKPQLFYTCVDCGGEFEGNPRRQRCGPCRDIYDRNRATGRMRKSREVKRKANPPQPKSFICEGCGEEFPQKFPSAHPRFCRPCWGEYKRVTAVANTRAWRAENKEAVAATVALRRRTDPKFALRMSISAQIGQSLKTGKAGRSWENLVGYTVVDLMAHLGRQFIRGMSWSNYGKKWEVDHIRPVASFSFTCPEDQGFKDCWALSNLRPLERRLNRSKREKLLFLI